MQIPCVLMAFCLDINHRTHENNGKQVLFLLKLSIIREINGIICIYYIN